MLRIQRILAAAILLLALAGTASAAVHVRVAIDPPTIPQCTQAHFAFALSNDGTDPLRVRLNIALLRDDQVLLGPLTLPLRLAAGADRHREFDFLMPPVPIGHYGIAVLAQASDGSSERSVAAFYVPAATPPIQCPGGGDAASLLLALTNGMGTETPTAVEPKVWGSVKQLYH